MKREKWMCLLLALLLTGCAQSGREAPAAGGEAEKDALPVEEAAGQLTAVQTEGEARALTDEEVLNAYDRAVQAYGWFAQDPLPTASVEETLPDGVYQKVNDPGIPDAMALESYLRSLFSQEIVESLMAGQPDCSHYADVNGALYVRVGGRAKDPHVGRIQTQVEQTGDASYSVNVTAELLGDDLTTVTGMELGAFPYEYQEDRWVFTQFRLMN